MARLADIVYWVRARKRAVTLAEISAEFEISTGKVITTVNRLVEQGELLDHGGDRITAAPPKHDREPRQAPPVQARLWKAASYLDLKGPWMIRTVASLAEANLDYARDYVHWLAEQGHLKKIVRSSNKAYRYRLHPDAPPRKRPRPG